LPTLRMLSFHNSGVNENLGALLRHHHPYCGLRLLNSTKNLFWRLIAMN